MSTLVRPIHQGYTKWPSGARPSGPGSILNVRRGSARAPSRPRLLPFAAGARRVPHGAWRASTLTRRQVPRRGLQSPCAPRAAHRPTRRSTSRPSSRTTASCSTAPTSARQSCRGVNATSRSSRSSSSVRSFFRSSQQELKFRAAMPRWVSRPPSEATELVERVRLHRHRLQRAADRRDVDISGTV